MIIRCLDCNCMFEHAEAEKTLNYRRFCQKCRDFRKEKCMQSYKSDKPIGRPRKDLINKIPDSISTWDEPNFGGY